MLKIKPVTFYNRTSESNFTFDEINRIIKLLDQFSKLQYIASLNPVIKENLCTFFYYSSLNDYRTITNSMYQNPNFRFLFLRLAKLYTNLKAGIADSISFDEIKFILGLDGDHEFSNKQKIDQTIHKLLLLETFSGLSFTWKQSTSFYSYTPYFFLQPTLSEKIYLTNKETTNSNALIHLS